MPELAFHGELHNKLCRSTFEGTHRLHGERDGAQALEFGHVGARGGLDGRELGLHLFEAFLRPLQLLLARDLALPHLRHLAPEVAHILQQAPLETCVTDVKPISVKQWGPLKRSP